jgi:undecaprenyl pyrophosphate phosphatase UppP
MELGPLVLASSLRGATEALPLSGPAHALLARLWLTPPPEHRALEPLVLLAVAAAMAFAVRGRLGSVVGEGLRAIARPGLLRSSSAAREAGLVALAALTSAGAAALVRSGVEGWLEAPSAVGLGLLSTAALLVTSRFAPRADVSLPSARAALLVGAAHGLSIGPGGSPLATGIVALVWLGVRRDRAVEIALEITMISLVVEFFRTAGPRGLFGAAAGPAILVTVVAFLTASVAASWLRDRSAERSPAVFALWLAPLGLAAIAYARALGAVAG